MQLPILRSRAQSHNMEGPCEGKVQLSAGLCRFLWQCSCRGTPLYDRTMRTSTHGGCTTGYMCAPQHLRCGQLHEQWQLL